MGLSISNRKTQFSISMDIAFLSKVVALLSMCRLKGGVCDNASLFLWHQALPFRDVFGWDLLDLDPVHRLDQLLLDPIDVGDHALHVLDH